MLGREPLLSAAEIFSLVETSAAQEFHYSPTILRISCPSDPALLISQLGGTIKIAIELATSQNESQLLDSIVCEARNVAGKINFGISVYPDADQPSSTVTSEVVENWAREVKEQLKGAGRSVRYISSDDTILNSATVFHNKLHSKGREFVVTRNSDGTYDLAHTRAVQPLEDFSARDFGRPGRDDVSGMLPPKLAMMMINLATQDSRMKIEDYTILDPFCGSGTILTEAIRLGFRKLVGTDNSEKAINDSKNNIDWTINSLNLESSIFSLDVSVVAVTTLATRLAKHSVHAIATEPYMGPPLRGTETVDSIKKTCNELADLYTKAFEQMSSVLKPGANVVFVIPRFFSHNQWLTISDKIIPKLKALGFEKQRLLPEALSAPSYILYHRPGQWVGREIWKFKKLA